MSYKHLAALRPRQPAIGTERQDTRQDTKMHSSIVLKSLRIRKRSLSLLAAILFLLCLPLGLAAQRRERVVDSWKPIHYDVALTLNDQLSEISAARTEITLEVLAANLTKVDLDFGELPIDALTVSGSPARFERQPDLLDVILPRAAKRGDKLSLTITYHGRPKDGLVFAKDRDGKPPSTGAHCPTRLPTSLPSPSH